MGSAVFSRLAHKISAMTGEIYPLHVGDTFMEPFSGGRMEDLRVDDHPGMHRYVSPQGIPELLELLDEKVTRVNGLQAGKGSILVTAGATGALAGAIGATTAPGDEVIILAPFWPLIKGIVSTMRATPVELPFFDRIATAEEAVAAIEGAITERTVAIYVSTPSNPTGVVLPEEWLEAIATLARRHNLWVYSDEVYEDLIYRGSHVSIGRFAPERTLTAFSFSKSYGMAGNRCGYLVGPPEVITQCRKVTTHTVYASPTAAQLAAVEALKGGRQWLDEAVELYRVAGERAAELLGVEPPAGSTFLFIDVSHKLDERGVFGFLEDCLDDGLLMAPGPSFGGEYANCVRLCFTSAPLEKVERAVGLLANRLK